MLLYTLENIKDEHCYCVAMLDDKRGFDEFLQEEYVPVYDEGHEFLGYKVRKKED